MPRTPDQYNGERYEQSLKLLDEGQGLSTEDGQVRYSGGRFSLKDSIGEYDPRTGSDELVKVSPNDTTAGRLLDKLAAGAGVTLTELADGGNEQLEIAFSGGGVATTTIFEAYDSVGGTNFTAGWTDIPFSAERTNVGSIITYTPGSAEIEFLVAGTFAVLANVSYFQNGGNNRSEASLRMLWDQGSGYAVIPGTLRKGYSRLNTQGDGSMAVQATLTVAVGDKLKVQAEKDSGNGILFSLAEGSNILVFSPKGEKGDKGDQGDPGTGGGISETEHRSLDQLVHTIAETSYEEISYTGNKVDSLVIWTSAAKTMKIREELFTYTGNKVTTIVTKQYDGSGVLVVGETLTETVVYSGNKVINTTKVLT